MAAPVSNRRQSTRNPRSSTTRPLNYYARSFSNRNSGAPSGPQDPTNAGSPSVGFYPAITHFTDAVDALPQEMIRHFSMLKEVEAKIYQPDEELQRLVDAIADLPPPPKTYEPAHTGRFPGLSAQNSVRNGSIRSVSANSAAAQAFLTVDPRQQPNGMAATPTMTEQNDIDRQQLFTQLRYTIMAMAPMLDEKNAVLSTANQTLKGQLERMESSYRCVDSEISLEARFGSRIHWAYVAEKEPAKKAGPERSRREAGTNNYLPADPELAARSEARREAVKEAKKKRIAHQQPVDSDFDDAPAVKKTAKGRKPGVPDADTAKSMGLGISHGTGTNGVQQGKKRRAPAGGAAAAPGMERTSSAMRGAFAPNPRETPMSDQGPKKRAKPAATAVPPKKRYVGEIFEETEVSTSADILDRQAATPKSPHIASSPIVGTFQIKDNGSKQPSNRAQHGSNHPLPPSLLSEVSHPLPPSPTTNLQTNGFSTIPLQREDANSMTKLGNQQPTSGPLPGGPPIALLNDPHAPEMGEEVKEEEEGDQELVATSDMTTQQAAPITKSGRASKAATPLTGTFPNLSGAKTTKGAPKGETNSGDNSHASSDSGHPERSHRRKGRHGSTSAASLLNEAAGSRKSTPRARSPAGTTLQALESTPIGMDDMNLPRLSDAETAKGANAHKSNGSEQVQSITASSRHPQSDSDPDEPLSTTKDSKYPFEHPPWKVKKSSSSRPSTATGKSMHKETSKPNASFSSSSSSTQAAKDHTNKINSSNQRSDSHGQSRSMTSSTSTSTAKAKEKERGKEKGREDTDREEYDDSQNGQIPADEPTYCYCNDVSYGQMIACDNEECPREWFHLKCTELDDVPDDPNWQWLCEICKGEREKERNGRR